MNELSCRERALVALGAAIASNCVPCVEFHVPEAKKAGLADVQIREAVGIADQVRRVPARAVLRAALTTIGDSPSVPVDAAGAGCGCA